MLSDLRIIDVDREFAELDDHMAAMNKSMRRARREMILAVYPWLTLMPLAAMIVVQSLAAMKRTAEDDDPSNPAPA